MPSTGEHFCHSFAKVHRSSPLAKRDALMVFKIIRAPSKLFQLIFSYVDIEAKKLIFEKRLPEGEEHYRRMIWKEHRVIDEDNSILEFDIWRGAKLTVNIKEQSFEYEKPSSKSEECSDKNKSDEENSEAKDKL